jgi:hypothetical protein
MEDRTKAEFSMKKEASKMQTFETTNQEKRGYVKKQHLFRFRSRSDCSSQPWQ